MSGLHEAVARAIADAWAASAGERVTYWQGNARVTATRPAPAHEQAGIAAAAAIRVVLTEAQQAIERDEDLIRDPILLGIERHLHAIASVESTEMANEIRARVLAVLAALGGDA